MSSVGVAAIAHAILPPMALACTLVLLSSEILDVAVARPLIGPAPLRHGRVRRSPPTRHHSPVRPSAAVLANHHHPPAASVPASRLARAGARGDRRDVRAQSGQDRGGTVRPRVPQMVHEPAARPPTPRLRVGHATESEAEGGWWALAAVSNPSQRWAPAPCSASTSRRTWSARRSRAVGGS